MSSSDGSGDNGYAMADIEYPGVHDVLCGRGGHAISHSGNVNFRMLVEQFKPTYVNATRYEKAKVTANVVRMWRGQSPPGRFLIVTDHSKGEDIRWHDIGDVAASKKVAQSLRERNPRTESQYPPATPSEGVAPVAAAPQPVPAAPPSSAVAAMPYATPSNHPMEWKQRKLQQQQRKQADHPQGKPAAKGSVAHPQQHPKHHTQRQRQRKQNAFDMQVQKQVEQAEQDVMLAQQQLNQQAQHLQTALVQRAQQETAVAATQIVLNQMAIQQVQQEILKEQAAVQQNLKAQHQQAQLRAQQVQQQVVQQQVQQAQQDAKATRDDASSDGLSLSGSPIMWEGSPADGDETMQESMGESMPSARQLTKNAFDGDEPSNGSLEEEPTNASSDSSTATSATMNCITKMLYNQLDSFSDTTSERSSNDVANTSDSGAMSDGSNSIARSYSFPPD